MQLVSAQSLATGTTDCLAPAPVARVTLIVGAIRLTVEEKVEPIFEETQELLVRFAP